MAQHHNGDPVPVFLFYAILTGLSCLLLGDTLSGMLNGTTGMVAMGFLIAPSVVRGVAKEWATGTREAQK
jgi:hypothetical protein